ncbi:MAG: hypothetical protein WCP15_00120 [bacterium]
MPFSFWTFIIALLGIIAMILFKVWEIKSGKATLLAHLTSKTNHIAHHGRERVFSFFRTFNRRNVFHWAVTFAHGLLIAWNSAVNWVRGLLLRYSHSRRLIEAVRGRYELAQRREASPFLKKIEHERNM